jgi:integrase
MTVAACGPDPEDIAAARVLLKRMGVSPEDLVNAPGQRPVVPTFAEYIPVVSRAVKDGTRRVYASYWKKITEWWGARRLDEPTVSEIEEFGQWVQSRVVVRRNARGGTSAVEHLIAAFRCVYHHAVVDGLITESQNPARKAQKPRRQPSDRCGLQDQRVVEINRVAATTGNDPVLDSLLLRLHTETACRRGGALALQLGDLDADDCVIRLREKGQTQRWQPVSPTLLTHLQAHARERGVVKPTEHVLRYRNGRALTYRRYDHLWGRLGQYLPWVATQGISTHWLRHTTLTWVERNFGYAVARAYAGHTDRAGDGATTTTYIRANRGEIATALAAMTGEPHPLAVRQE